MIVKNRQAFAKRYGTAGITLAPGVYTGSLNNGGETLKLDDGTNSTILEFEYDDQWFSEADGAGHSLTIKDAADADRNSWNTLVAWRPSAQAGGTPGTD